MAAVQVPGLIVMQVMSADALGVEGTSDPEHVRVVVVVNARPAPCAGPLPEGVPPPTPQATACLSKKAEDFSVLAVWQPASACLRSWH